jgi:hypothetical protein
MGYGERDFGVHPRRSGSFAVIEGRAPVAGVDYPQDADDFATMFDSDAQCRALIERLRYPNGFDCERCHSRDEPWRSGTGLIACQHCRQPIPLTQGTIFHGTHVPLKRWFALMWEMTSCDGAMTDARAQELLGVADERTAREHADRVRNAMARPEAENVMSGVVHVGVSRLEMEGMNAVVALAVKTDGRGHTRVRLQHLRRVKSDALVRFVEREVAIGSQVCTSGLKGFASLRAAGFEHRVSSSPEVRHIASLLELWLWCRPPRDASMLQSQLDEFSFRHNRQSYPPGLLFYRLAILAAMSDDPRAAFTGYRDAV